MEIKVCGLTTAAQLEAVHRLGAQYAGLIFYPRSPRYAATLLRPAAVRALPGRRAGVFVDAEAAEVISAAEAWGLEILQLHGTESPQYCSSLRDVAEVWKVFRLKGDEEVDGLVQPYLGSVDGFLFDTSTDQYGGSGQRFDWTALLKAEVGRPFFLSGGIGPGDAEELRTLRHPFLRGVDINSRFETAPGVKDLGAVASFIKQVNAHG